MKRLTYLLLIGLFSACFNITPKNSGDADTQREGADAVSSIVTDTPSVIVRCKAIGDLNGDRLADSVIVTQDTATDYAEYTLAIYLTSPQGLYLNLITDSAIRPEYPNGREAGRYGDDFDTAMIIKGILSIGESLLRGHFENKYRFQNGRFEMIGHTYTESNGYGIMEKADYNLSTGRYHYLEERYDTDLVIRRRDNVYFIDPKPDLAHFVPFTIPVDGGLFSL